MRATKNDIYYLSITTVALDCDAGQGNRMNAVRINSSPFKGEVGRGMGYAGWASHWFAII